MRSYNPKAGLWLTSQTFTLWLWYLGRDVYFYSLLCSVILAGKFSIRSIQALSMV